MARPKKAAGTVREKKLSIRLSPGEMARMEAAAKADGRNLNALARAILLAWVDGELPERPAAGPKRPRSTPISSSAPTPPPEGRPLIDVLGDVPLEASPTGWAAADGSREIEAAEASPDQPAAAPPLVASPPLPAAPPTKAAPPPPVPSPAKPPPPRGICARCLRVAGKKIPDCPNCSGRK